MLTESCNKTVCAILSTYRKDDQESVCARGHLLFDSAAEDQKDGSRQDARRSARTKRALSFSRRRKKNDHRLRVSLRSSEKILIPQQ